MSKVTCPSASVAAWTSEHTNRTRSSSPAWWASSSATRTASEEKSSPVTRAPASAQASVSSPKWHSSCTRSRPRTSPRASATRGRGSGRERSQPSSSFEREAGWLPPRSSHFRRLAASQSSVAPSIGAPIVRSPSMLSSRCSALDTQLSILSSRYSALDNVSEQINPHAFGPQPLDGSVDSRPIAVQLADDPPAVLTHIGAADVRHDVELFDHAGDDRLAHQLIRKRQLYPHADHRLPPGADVSDRSDSAPPPCSASLRFPERNPSRSRVT